MTRLLQRESQVVVANAFQYHVQRKPLSLHPFSRKGSTTFCISAQIELDRLMLLLPDAALDEVGGIAIRTNRPRGHRGSRL